MEKYVSGYIKFIGNDRTMKFRKQFRNGHLCGSCDWQLGKIVSVHNSKPAKYSLGEKKVKWEYDYSKINKEIDLQTDSDEDDPRRYNVYPQEVIADDWCSKNEDNIYSKHCITKDDVLLTLAIYANHCRADLSGLPNVVELPLDFSFVEEYYSFDKLEYNTMNKNVKALPNDNIRVTTMNDMFMHYDIRVGSYVSGLQIKVVSGNFSNVPNVLYYRALKLDPDTLKELFYNKDVRLDEFFDIVGVPMISITNSGSFRDENPTVHRKQVYHNGEIVFDGTSRSDVHRTISYSYDKESKTMDFSEMNYEGKFHRSDILVNRLCEFKTELDFLVPEVIHSNQIFMRQFIGASYENYRFAHGYLKDGKYHVEIYDISYKNGLVAKRTDIHDPKNMDDSFLKTDVRMNVISDIKTGDIVSDFIADGDNNQEITAKYLYKGYTVMIRFKNELGGQINDNSIPYINKKIMLDNVIIFEGEIVDDEPTIIINNLNDTQKKDLYYSSDIVKFISEPDIEIDRDGEDCHIRETHEYNDLPISRYTTPISEVLETADPDVKFEFTYDYPIKIASVENVIAMSWNINGYGFFQKIKKMIIEKREKKKLVGIMQRNYTNKGHEELTEGVDEDNTFKVKSTTKKDIWKGTIGWKAAITENGDKCIVKLLIPKEAKVAWDPKYNKYRTSRAVTLSIKPVVKGTDDYYYKQDIELEKCPVCMDKKHLADVMAEPCRHKLCGSCWIAIIKSDNNKCPYCMQAVKRYQKLKISNDNKKLSLPEAYPFVHSSDLVYRVGEEVTVSNFNGDLNMVCAPGIHYHRKQSDVFKWFEFLDIPDGIKNILPDPTLDKHDEVEIPTPSAPPLQKESIDPLNELELEIKMRI
jgi:hypothetical protein